MNERYKIIYYHKIINVLVPNPGLTLNTLDSRRCPLITGMRAKKGAQTTLNLLETLTF